jgi:hypothetical protein
MPKKLPDASLAVPAAPLKLYTEAEVAAMFRVSKRTFVDFIGKHRFYRKLGKQKLFTDADITQLYEHLDEPLFGRPQQMQTAVFRSPASEAAIVEKLMRERLPRRKRRPKAGEP